MTANKPTLEEIAAGADLRSLPIDLMALLQEEAEAVLKTAQAAKRTIADTLAERFKTAADAAYAAEAKDFGTVRVPAGDGYELVLNRAKSVEWDQALLAATAARIRDAGDDPAEMIDTKLSVAERKFSAMPSFLRRQFEDARTVKPGSVSATLARADAQREAA